MARVVLAMSGGVDSSVSARLLLDEGHEVIGVFMRTGAKEPEPAVEACSPAGGKHRGCCSAIDAADGQRVADRLGIPFYALDFEGEFNRIKDYFADEYLAGRTPNPCVVCNTWLKFGRLWDYAQAVGADLIATGHYARIDPGPPPRLRQAADASKDQCYFLFGVAPRVLARTLFPVGHLTKPEVRALAERYGLEVHRKPDSQEVCFVPDGDHQAFIRRHRPDAEKGGEIVDVERGVVGAHSGVSRYTLGQRKGLGVASGERRFVVGLEPDARRVLIGPESLLRRRELTAERVNWLAPPPPGPIRAAVQIRYRHRPAPATIEPRGGMSVTVRFDEPQAAVTPGQAAVFHDGDAILGGGWIV